MNGFQKDPALAKKQKNKGVTLVELLIVVLILAALAAIAIPRISQSVYNAKLKACETQVNIMNQAIENYYLANGVFPAGLRTTILRDPNLFPSGPPKCPVTGRAYREALTAEHRVDARCDH